jgi:biopolymer transport protein ExbB
LWSLLAQAGVSMVPLYLCSVVALTVTVHKSAQFAVHRVGEVTSLQAAARHDPESLAEHLGEASPLARVLSTAVRVARTDPTRAEAAASRVAARELDRYTSGLALLAYVAEAAPLFGLLGTVLGMVDLFSGMQGAGAAAASATLASGIWKALLTTAAGLMVAIPTLGVHLWLSRRLTRLQLHMEVGVGELLARLS